MSQKPPPLRVVLCWHMHQPQYFDPESGQYQLPWTYLHAIKDYVDMAAVIEECEGAKAVVNFAPILLEQLDDYAGQVKDYLRGGKPLRDPLLAALASAALPHGSEFRLSLIKSCLRANRKRLIERFAPFNLLASVADFVSESPGALRYLDESYLTDILVWYHLAWIGETVRRTDGRVQALMKKGQGFSHRDRTTLLEIIAELLSGVVGRYRKLAEAGRVELSANPYAHPIVPLLIDTHSAREAMPEVALPATTYPGGRERALWHIQEGNAVFAHHFGFKPAGCWPSEGGVSRETLALFAEAGYRWVASGESVLHHSLDRSGLNDLGCIHRPYQVEGLDLSCFFRDDGLSDLIGFTYADWHADDAVDNLIHHLGNIANACGNEDNRVVSIIMDGENAWEHYPDNGYYFLTALYQRLAEQPDIELTTFSECLDAKLEAQPLRELVAGSWVYGTFSTWIGDPDKNRGWELLIEAKRVFDRVMAEDKLHGARRTEAERQLAICEGSDWFWWFGDYNPADSVQDFDRLFRLQLINLYRLLGEPAPPQLSRVISHGGGTPEGGGAMRRGKQ